MRRSDPHYPPLWLQTPRLMLRPLRHDDLDQMAALLGDADALLHWGPPLDREGASDWILRNRKRYETDGFGRCAIELAGTDELIGDCGLIRTTVEGSSEVELGWIVRRTYWGRGFATEAAAAWRDFAFGLLGLERIVSIVAADNVASRRVAEKLGMTVERPAIWGGAPMLVYVCQELSCLAHPCRASGRHALRARVPSGYRRCRELPIATSRTGDAIRRRVSRVALRSSSTRSSAMVGQPGTQWVPLDLGGGPLHRGRRARRWPPVAGARSLLQRRGAPVGLVLHLHLGPGPFEPAPVGADHGESRDE